MHVTGGSRHTRTVAAEQWPIERLVDDVAELGRRALPREHYYGEVTARLRRVVDCDAACWHTLDPETRLITGDAPSELITADVFTEETIADAGARLIASEYFVPDVNTFSGLASRRVTVGILSQATKGRPERSTRYRELLAPAGIPFEMRAAFVSRGRAWGAVHLARHEHKRDFSPRDADALTSVTAVIADGIRTSLRFDAARNPGDGAAPGFVVLTAANEIELVTPPARELLAAMASGDRSSVDRPPSPVLALANFIRGQTGRPGQTGHRGETGHRGRPGHPGETVDAVAVPTSSGWITLHASLPEGRADGRVAVVLERAMSPQATAVRLEADGVTPREREVATLLAQGLTYQEIAVTLVISPYTVQDHIKNLFEKTGVSSRQELVARVFLDEYLPRVAQGSPLGANGSFIRPTSV